MTEVLHQFFTTFFHSMVENSLIVIAQKLGCEQDGLDNCILVKASVEAVSTIIQQYFALEVRSKCRLADYVDAKKASRIEVERPVSWTYPFWQYTNHQWTILPPLEIKESIAFALALLLNTDAITFYDCSNASEKEFKVFRKDLLVEHYLFGFECKTDFNNDWDVKISNWNTQIGDSWFDPWNDYEHRFKSSLRQVSEAELRSAFLSRKHNRDDRGFLDLCLKHHKAYIPLAKETPYRYRYHDQSNSDYDEWDSIVERMDMMIVPSNWRYFDLKVPNRVV